MVSAVKDQSGDIPTNNAFLEDDQIFGAQSDTAFSPVDLHATKARKPYTITKQRERWTDEEHKKFIEALKLYGRAWRRIEEHVGTKTAVQIRSHAQKFFSKVVRDSSGSHTSSAEPIEIPPPRPKRKPMHPYPRKMVHPHKKGVSVPQLLLRSASPISEQENRSPTSVLSAIGSDTLGSASSNSPTGSVSPVSSGAGISNPNSVLLSEPSALQEENISSPDPEAAGVQDDHVSEKFEYFPEDNTVCPKERVGGEESMRCLKLFGRTLLVMDSDRPFSSAMDVDSKPKLSDMVNGKRVQTPSWSCGSGDCLVANSDPVSDKMEHGAPGGRSIYHTHYPNGNSNPNEATLHHALLPVWAFYGGTSFPYHPSGNPESIDKMYQGFSVGAGLGKEVQKEGSWSGSNAESVCEVGGNDDKNWDLETQSCQISSDREEREHPSVRGSKQIEKSTSRCMKKGFVPYKRCLAERDTQSSTMTGEGEEQRVRLCL